MGNFKELKVWQRAHCLTLEIYRLTRHFPATERYGLGQQIRSAAISIASNIAEGCARPSNADFARFLAMARGSAAEVECQLMLARDLEYLSTEEWSALEEQAQEVSRMVNGLSKSIRAKGEG